MIETVLLRHSKVDLALHHVRDAAGADDRPLLLLHGLGERTPTTPPPYLADWPGRVWGLDFTGHGASTRPVGGGYTAEILLADANVALTHLGSATVLGRGLGAWIALLLAGARPLAVRGVVLADGPGLIGGGIRPGSSTVVPALVGTTDPGDTPDPFALAELAHDIRPPDYATTFVRFAVEGSEVDDPVVVATVSRPEWLAAVATEPGVTELPLTAALARFAIP
jgi:pimeloyl-ACP methyl ester carboxylesterase